MFAFEREKPSMTCCGRRMDYEIHDQHVDIAHQGVEAAKIKYAVGKVPQQDILKAEVSLTRLAEHLIHFEQDADLARARLNTLLGPRSERSHRCSWGARNLRPTAVDRNSRKDGASIQA